MIHLARVLAGLSLGTCLYVTPMYLGEIASIDRRGAIGSSMGVMLNIGILFSYGICPYLSIATVAGILMTITLTFVVTFWFMPESPYFLALRGRMADAEVVLLKLRGKTDVTEELNMIKESMPQSKDPKKTKSKPGGIKELFATSANRRAFTISALFIIPQNLGGFFSILVYGELIFQAAGSFVPSHLALIAVGIAQLVSAIIAGALVDKLGRKPMIFGAGAIAGLANLTIACYLFAKEYMNVDVSEYSLFFFIAVLVEIFAFNCGLLSTHAVIMSEIFTTEVKGIGMCICVILGGIFSVIASKLYIAVAVTWGLGHSIAFFGSTILVWSFTIAIIIVTPETKGKTFAQIQQHLNS